MDLLTAINECINSHSRAFRCEILPMPVPYVSFARGRMIHSLSRAVKIVCVKGTEDYRPAQSWIICEEDVRKKTTVLLRRLRQTIEAGSTERLTPTETETIVRKVTSGSLRLYLNTVPFVN